jgi:hypothetical protein
MAEEADRASGALSQHARKHLKDVNEVNLRDYYLSDSGLDRYSKLGIAFDFEPATSEFVYDGRAYRQILKRFPNSAEAALARKRLNSVEHYVVLLSETMMLLATSGFLLLANPACFGLDFSRLNSHFAVVDKVAIITEE